MNKPTIDSDMVHAAFIAMGMNGAPLHFNATLDTWDGGCLELIQEATRYAPYITALTTAGYEATGGVPGISEYEIAEEFGVWFIGQMGRMPEPLTVPKHEYCCGKLMELAVAFFANSVDAEGKPILAENVALALALAPEMSEPTSYAEI